MGFLGHSWEIIIICVVALLIFGPKKLPEMGAAIGKSIKEFQKGMKEITNTHDDEPATSLETVERENVAKRTATESPIVDNKTTAE